MLLVKEKDNDRKYCECFKCKKKGRATCFGFYLWWFLLVLVLPLCLKVHLPFIFPWKTVASLKAPTAPCMDGGKPKVLPSFNHMLLSMLFFLMTKKTLFLLQVAYCVFCILLCADTGHDEALNSVIMPMVDNDMCSQIKEDAGESRICAGGKRGEGVCDVRISNRQMHPKAKQHGCELNARCLKVHFTTSV